jgi:hypothetical protein
VKRLLQKALANVPRQSQLISPVDLDIWDLDELMVQREWQNIDILLTDRSNQLAVIIENKIGSSEHGEQLPHYRAIVGQHFPGWHILGLFLTPDGDKPSDEFYLPIDYASVCELLEQLIKTRSSTMGPDVKVAIDHYTQMLRRHIVSKSEIADLCEQIYHKHKHALDLIFEHRPDRQAEINDLLVSLIESQQTLQLDHSTKSYIRFAVKDWDKPIFLEGDGWTESKRILLFEISNLEDWLKLYLIIGPGPKETRQHLLDMAYAHTPLFRPSQHALGRQFNTIYTHSILTTKDYEGTSEEIEAEIRKKWQQFLEHDLPPINEILNKESWIWK